MGKALRKAAKEAKELLKEPYAKEVIRAWFEEEAKEYGDLIIVPRKHGVEIWRDNELIDSIDSLVIEMAEILKENKEPQREEEEDTEVNVKVEVKKDEDEDEKDES